MLSQKVIIAAGGAAAVLASVAGAAAQGCIARSGAGAATSREVALRTAFESVVRATDASAVPRWVAGGRRVGDVPGYTIVKMTSTCTPTGSSFSCHIAATLCRK
jgi:hypothetical protein